MLSLRERFGGAKSTETSEAPVKESLVRFFGDFFLDVESKLVDIADDLRSDLGPFRADMTLKDLVTEHLGTTLCWVTILSGMAYIGWLQMSLTGK